MGCMYLLLHLFLIILYYCRALKYIMLLEDSSVLAIPDPKWHFFKNTGETLHGNITTSTPVLRACAVYEVFEAYFYRGQPRTELLLLFPHVKGEHLFNLTLANENFYVNRKFYVHVTWALQEVRTSVRFHKSARLSRVRATHETGRELSIGNGNLTTPKIPWVYNSVPNPEPHRAINGMTSFPCSEMKIKVADGYVDYQIGWISVAFPTEPYDDTFFTTTSTTIASTVTTERQDHTGFETTPSETETNKASVTIGFLFAIGGVLVMIAAGILFYVGFRMGQWYAKKAVVKQALL